MELSKLYNTFKIESIKVNIPNKKDVEKGEEKSEVKEEENKLWSSSYLPETEYTKDNSLQNQSKIEEIDNMKVGNTKFIRIVHNINIEMIKRVTAEDLIAYDGYKSTKNITHMQNFNKGIQNYLNNRSFDQLKKMAKETEILHNYNLIDLIVSSMQNKQLSTGKREDLVFYRNLLEKQEGGILPFEWMLKDCSDSNNNVNSDVASVRFCTIVEKLNEMQKISETMDLKEKHRHYVYNLAYKNRNSNNKRDKEEYVTNYLFLVME